MSNQLAERLSSLLETTLNPRTGRRWTQKELVDTINESSAADGSKVLSYSYLSSLCLGVRVNPDPSIVRAIANALRVPAASLLVDESELEELPADLRQLPLTPDETDVLRQVAVAFVSARDQAVSAARYAALPEFAALAEFTEVQAYAATAVTRQLGEAADLLRNDLDQPDIAGLVDELARRIRSHFASLGSRTDNG